MKSVDVDTYIYMFLAHLRLVVRPGGLLISSAQQADEGRYQCIARNIAGVRRSTQALLSVYGELPPVRDHYHHHLSMLQSPHL